MELSSEGAGGRIIFIFKNFLIKAYICICENVFYHPWVGNDSPNPKINFFFKPSKCIHSKCFSQLIFHMMTKHLLPKLRTDNIILKKRISKIVPLSNWENHCSRSALYQQFFALYNVR